MVGVRVGPVAESREVEREQRKVAEGRAASGLYRFRGGAASESVIWLLAP